MIRVGSSGSVTPAITHTVPSGATARLNGSTDCSGEGRVRVSHVEPSKRPIADIPITDHTLPSASKPSGPHGGFVLSNSKRDHSPSNRAIHPELPIHMSPLGASPICQAATSGKASSV